MSVVGAIRRMLQAGLEIQQALIAAEAFEQESEASKIRSSGAERQARYRERKALHTSPVTSQESPVTESYENDANGCEEPRAPAFFIGEDSNYIPPSETTSLQAPLKIEPAFENPKSSKRQNSDVLAILATVLCPEIAAGVIDHRKKLRKPITAMAAQGLAKQFAATGHPDEAARMMVERGWQGFKPEWFENDRAAAQPRGSPAGKRPTEVDFLIKFANECDRRQSEPERHEKYRSDESEITLAASEYREGS